MRRRYTSARNPIEALRERWGLGDTEQSQSVPTGEGPSVGVHPLPLTPEQSPEPYSQPLPAMPGDVLSDAPLSSDSGTVDYEARQRSQLDDIPQGDHQEPVTVYPAWESRLEGMRDFLAVGIPSESEGAQSIDTPGSFTLNVYTVPQGYTAFLKGFRYFFDPIPGGVTLVNMLATLQVDGVIVPDYFNLPLGAFMAQFQKTFVIASEGRVLQLKLEVTEALGGLISFDDFPLRALFYGNVRKRTGEPESRDVGVRPPSPPPPVIVQAAPAPRAPQPPPPPSSSLPRPQSRGFKPYSHQGTPPGKVNR